MKLQEEFGKVEISLINKIDKEKIPNEIIVKLFETNRIPMEKFL